jgi:hypothetical protein
MFMMETSFSIQMVQILYNPKHDTPELLFSGIYMPLKIYYGMMTDEDSHCLLATL